MQKTIFYRVFQCLWVPVLLILSALAFYMTAAHVFWVQLAQMGDGFAGIFFWLLMGLCGIAVLALTGWVRKTTCNLIAVLYFVAVIGVLFGKLFFGTIFSITDVIKDPAYYETALQSLSMDQRVDGFPEQIPSNAQAVQFAYAPGFAQGGESLTLKFQTDEEELRRYRAIFARKAAASGMIASFAGTPYEIPARMAGAPYDEVPSDYMVYILSAQDHRDNWNHGTCSLVGISQEKGEITFLAENW